MNYQAVIDTHCHLDLIGSEQEILEAIDNAKKHNIIAMHTICTKRSGFEFIRNIIDTYDNIYGSVGIHPNEAEKTSFSLQELIELSKHPKIISIGETGLDYYYEKSNRKIQQESFRTHIHAARETGLPIVIHTRNADDDTISILKEEMQDGKFKGLIHCFTASKKLADIVLDLGLYISLSGIVTFKNSNDLRDIIKHIPLQRILIETDAPYLAPVPVRGKINQPANVQYIAEYLADFFQIPIAEFAKITTNNAIDLFALKLDKI
jgi:TatD DNase family protein